MQAMLTPANQEKAHRGEAATPLAPKYFSLKGKDKQVIVPSRCYALGAGSPFSHWVIF
jgi:hypothetical protein